MRKLIYTLAAAAAALTALFAIGAAPASAATTASITGTTLNVTGDDAGEKVTLMRTTAGGPNLGVDVGDDGTFDQTFALADFATISIAAGGGADTVKISDLNGAFTDTKPTTIDGGDGNDTLVGGLGAETIGGGPGDDFIDPNRGNDVGTGGPGNDTFTWDPGDGSDKDDGDDGVDLLAFNGANVAENFTFAPNGNRVTMHRDVANITMDLGTIDRVKVLELGANDTTTASAGVRPMVIDVDGGAGADTFSGSTEDDVVSGGTEDDAISTGGGDDSISGNEGADTVDGEDGNDTVNGNDGADTLHGGAGNDSVKGDAGDDQVFGDAGTDTLDGGDGADTVHCGGAGDTVVFDATDLISGDCLPFPLPPGPDNSQGNPPVTTTTTGAPAANDMGNATGQQGQGQMQGTGTTGLAAGERGFASPRIRAAGANLRVTLANTAASPIHVSVVASERVGHKKVAYGSASLTLAPGQTRTVTLRASKAARKALRGHHKRHPVVTVRNVDTGGALTLKPRLK
jgi:Ca2+-binding RTX toxin-like protein